MSPDLRDVGTLAALTFRIERFRLPRILQLREKVISGKTLSSADLHYISTSLDRTRQVLPLVDRHPKYQVFVARMLSQYIEVVSTGLENERSRWSDLT